MNKNEMTRIYKIIAACGKLHLFIQYVVRQDKKQKNMKIKHLIVSFILVFLVSGLKSQDIDTLVDIGNQNMHFNIWKGNGIPILFESGGGNDGNIWLNIANEIHSITGSTIITYDRVGYGKSEFNPDLPDNKKALIIHGISALEKGLKELKLFDELILVGHSYGGYYSTYLASTNPSKVKGMVLIDAVTSCFHTKEFIAAQKKERTIEWLNNIKGQSEPLYYECLSNIETIEIMKNHSVPFHIPVINLVAENPPYEDSKENERWKTCQQEFVSANPNRKGIVASNCGHYLHFDNPKLAVDAIISLVVESGADSTKIKILEKYLTYSNEYTNNYRRQEYEYWHSERDLNRWGYSLLAEKKLPAALKLLELNTILYPESFNTWDSYGEVLLMNGDKEKAKRMYEKSLALNPENDNAKEVLKNIEK